MFAKPIELLAQCDDTADDYDGRAAQTGIHCLLGQVGQCAGYHLLIRACAIINNRSRCGWIGAAGNKFAAELA